MSTDLEADANTSTSTGSESGEPLRDQVPYWIIAVGGRNSKKTLHAPHPTSTRENPEVQCRRTTHHSDWVAKDVQVIPPGYYPVCKSCRRRLEQ